jgi:hypothetical protein
MPVLVFVVIEIYYYYRAPESANPSGLPTDPSQMAVTMEMSMSANQIAGFNPRIRQLPCVRPLFVTD